MDRDGIVIYEVKVPSTPADIRGGTRPSSSLQTDRVRDRPDGAMLYHGLSHWGCPSSALRAGRPIKR